MTQSPARRRTLLRPVAALSLLLSAPSWAAEPIRVHPANPHYFLYQGKPMVIVGSGEHYGSVLNLDFDFKKYLDTLAADGMNYTRLFTGSYVEVPGDFGIERNTLAPVPGRFLSPWLRNDGGYDLDRWNPVYFQRLREFVTEAQKRGVIVELTLFTSTYSKVQWGASPFNPANNANKTAVTDFHELNTLNNGNVLAFQEKLVRKLVRDLNDLPNLTFEIQNEPWADRGVLADVVNPYLREPARDMWPNSVDLADAASLAWQARVASWIRSEEAALANKHLIAWNICNFLYPVREIVPDSSIINFHYAYPEAASWNQALNMPIACDETGFMGSSDFVYRREAWRFLLAGGGLFNHLDYSFSLGKEDGTDSQPKSPGGGSPALRRQFRALSEFMNALPFLQMRPDREAVLAAPGAIAQAFSAKGQAYAVYLSGSGPGDLSLEVPAGEYQLAWLDPSTGSWGEKRSIQHRGGKLSLKTPAFKEDAALRLLRPKP